MGLIPNRNNYYLQSNIYNTKVKAIYNAGKRNNRASDPPVDAKTTHFLVLISEGFREARGALSRSGANLPSNQSPVKVDSASTIPVTGGTSNYITISEWIYCKPTTNTCWDCNSCYC